MGLIHHNHRPPDVLSSVCHSALLAFQFVKSGLIFGQLIIEVRSLQVVFLTIHFTGLIEDSLVVSSYYCVADQKTGCIVFPTSSVSPHNN